MRHTADFLRSSRWEVSRASNCAELLFKFAPGTSEYDLVRKIDLSFGDPELSGLQYRSYCRLLGSVQGLERYDQRYGASHYIGSLYLDALAHFYNHLAESYLAHSLNLNRNFVGGNDDYESLLLDFHRMQATGILSLNFSANRQEIIGVLGTESNRQFYEQGSGLIRRVISDLQFGFEERTDMSISQLSALAQFYDSIGCLIDMYASSRQAPAAQESTPDQVLSSPGVR